MSRPFPRALRMVATALAFAALASAGARAYVVPNEPLMELASGGSLGLAGSWTAEVTPADRGATPSLKLNLRRKAKSGDIQHSLVLALSDLRGLSAEQAVSGSGEVEFRLLRDAGSIHFQGRLQAREGSGQFTFVPSVDYLAFLRPFGHRTVDAEQAYVLAAVDVSRAFVLDLFRLGYYRLSLDELKALRIQGADALFVRAMAALGYAPLSVDQLKAARSHGVSPEFIGEMASAGQPSLALNELLSFRIHGVSPAFVREMKAAGYERLTAERLVAMRIHGVTAEFVRELRAMGYRAVPPDDLVRFRIHGVTPEFIRNVNGASTRPASVDRLLALRLQDGRGAAR
jgi:hypothetical protein